MAPAAFPRPASAAQHTSVGGTRPSLDVPLPDLPDGVELQYTHWGDPKDDVLMSAATGTEAAAVQPASSSYIPYYQETDRSKKCRANDDTCNGWRVKDSEFCSGHAGLMKRDRIADEPR